MCHHCDYSGLLEESGLGHTTNRHRVLEVIGNNSSPLSAQQIFDTLNRTDNINRVTVYRILDLLVAKGLVDRISGGGRSRPSAARPVPSAPGPSSTARGMPVETTGCPTLRPEVSS